MSNNTYQQQTDWVVAKVRVAVKIFVPTVMSEFLHWQLLHLHQQYAASVYTVNMPTTAWLHYYAYKQISNAKPEQIHWI